MTDCCSTTRISKSGPKRHLCPVNGNEYQQVPLKTVLQHIKEPWAWAEKQPTYYFCEDPSCDVVYFSEDDTVIETAALRTQVGIKSKEPGALLCYCFGVSYADIATNPGIRQFVIDKTKTGMCACDIQNPSGKCCLKTFPK